MYIEMYTLGKRLLAPVTFQIKYFLGQMAHARPNLGSNLCLTVLQSNKEWWVSEIWQYSVRWQRKVIEKLTFLCIFSTHFFCLDYSNKISERKYVPK